MGYKEKVRAELKPTPEETAFLGIVDNLFSEFVTTTSKDGLTTIPPLIKTIKGERIKMVVIGRRNIEDFLEEAKLVIVKKVSGKLKFLPISVFASGRGSYPNMSLALNAMHSIEGYYQHSNLPRKTAA
jgi:hypothetical protein